MFICSSSSPDSSPPSGDNSCVRNAISCAFLSAVISDSVCFLSSELLERDFLLQQQQNRIQKTTVLKMTTEMMESRRMRSEPDDVRKPREGRVIGCLRMMESVCVEDVP